MKHGKTIEELAGMTVNERLVVCDLMEHWDAAVRKRDRDKMISILQDALFTAEQAASTTEAVLRRPDKYGF